MLQPRDHQAALSLYRDRGEKWGIAQFGREEGLVRPPARVTDPAVVTPIAPATDACRAYDDA